MDQPELDLTSLRSILLDLAPKGRSALLPALHAAQEIYGYLPEPVAQEIARALAVPLVEVHGVIDFYANLYRRPVGKTMIHVCNDPACMMAGADGVFKVIKQHLEQQPEGKSITVEQSPCLGLCALAPALLYDGKAVGMTGEQTYEDLMAGNIHHLHSQLGGDISILTSNCGKDEPTSLAAYIENGGYAGLKKALSLSPEQVIAEVKASGLVGRGGAAFPTGVKWEGAYRAPAQPKYVVCNADEAEPGTFKDRILMEGDPHRILEGLMIAAYAIGAEQGYVYIRGEYLEAYNIMKNAADEAYQAGYLGQNILGSGFSFELELRRGAGAYICGEETALFESIEGKRGFPRLKPPFPTTVGLFGKPTVINNVETLANIPTLIANGSAAYRQIGTEKSPGPKLFCLSGDVARPGLYEVPFGVTFRHLLYDLAGGVRPGHQLRAALFGGAAGAFATPDDLDVRLTFEDLRAANLPLGSGVITVFDDTRDPRDILVRLARFFAEESCGKCYPCQIGTQRQYEIIQQVAEGNAKGDFVQAGPGDIAR
ncbi:MAG TPA: NAD(P)H-dependent oxidoreductase subunit E, partial [Anaerolineales bacterium]